MYFSHNTWARAPGLYFLVNGHSERSGFPWTTYCNWYVWHSLQVTIIHGEKNSKFVLKLLILVFNVLFYASVLITARKHYN